jgi:hypothetical protein
MPRYPLRAITALADYHRFGVLPYAGGSFQQPAELMEELRLAREWAAEQAEIEAERRRAD